MTKEMFDEMSQYAELDEVLILAKHVNTDHTEISGYGDTDDIILAATKTIIGAGEKSPRNTFQWINAATTICAHIRKMYARDDEKDVIQGFSFDGKEKAPEAAATALGTEK